MTVQGEAIIFYDVGKEAVNNPSPYLTRKGVKP